MKKLFFALIMSIVLSMGASTVYADTYNNSAYIGTWLSAGATADNYGELTLYYCDSDTFNCRFVYKKSSRPENIYYTMYQGVMNDTYGTARFSVSSDSASNYAYGTLELYLYSAQVRVKLTLDSGILMYDGWLDPQMGFEPYTTAYNYDVSVTLNGSAAETTKPPIIIRDRTYVPVRGIFEACGINVYWDEFSDTQQITLTRENTISQIRRVRGSEGYAPWSMDVWSGADADTVYDPSKTEDISDIQPIILDTTAYMPLRAIAETFGVIVDWDADNRTVILQCDTDVLTKKTRAETDAIEDFLPDVALAKVRETYPEADTEEKPYFTLERKYYKFADSVTAGKVYDDGVIETD